MIYNINLLFVKIVIIVNWGNTILFVSREHSNDHAQFHVNGVVIIVEQAKNIIAQTPLYIIKF